MGSNSPSGTDTRWMHAAIALSQRGVGRTWPNPSVGCVIVRNGRAVGRGFTQPSGRPHAEALAVAQAGDRARGATAYVSLEPCAYPGRGPACADVLIDAQVARVVAACRDPFPAVDGKGFERLRSAGIVLSVGLSAPAAERVLAGFLMRQRRGRPLVTLKLATSLDGCIALADGRSRWITGPAARAHAHVERARSDAILVGRGTLDADAPSLAVRLPGLEDRSPSRYLLSTRPAPAGWNALPSLRELASIAGDLLLVEGGAGVATSFLAADLVDRLIVYRAPIVIGGGRVSVGDIGLGDLADAHGRWRLYDARQLGSDRVEVYERVREASCSPASLPI